MSSFIRLIKEKFCPKTVFVGNKAKRRISTRVFQETKAHQIFRKINTYYPLIRRRICAYQGVRNVHFSENLVCFGFLKHPFRDSPFCYITNDFHTHIFFTVISIPEKLFPGQDRTPANI